MPLGAPLVLRGGAVGACRRTAHLAHLALAMALSFAGSAVHAADAASLGGPLTPVGGERAANADGNIPAWSGENPVLPGWDAKKLRGEFWKYKGEKPKFSIDASNVDQHAERLSPGQIALIKQVQGYRADVYPTHRSCGVPDFVAENTKKNVGFAKIAEDGWTLKEAMLPGTPFPIPSSGIEAIWNQKMRYRGLSATWPNATANVSPRRGGDEWITAGYDETMFWPWAAEGATKLSETNSIYSHVYFTFLSPVALAGQAASITDYVNQPGTESYLYFPGQRRVRRLPSYAYDSPTLGFENQYALDETQVFMGAPDRFDWKLVGKKEIYVPYNSFGAYDFKAKADEVLLRDFIAPSHRRYELHRVWVVEGTVKDGVRHTSPKRVLYLDEDSWNAVLAEDYDAQGNLWKVREGYLIPVFETGSCDVAAFSQYNLPEGRYLIDFHTIGTGVGPQWTVEATGPRHRGSFYRAENLRAISDR
ncbi:DUF1329 domain-containing protein [Denitromonas sp. IR12]|uniref:DUF1329 domain-containing protein n=2 Tax=Denitromonas iodatirespirans TaxID=2795389 RepID=A0A944D7R1_DENI1|nr:DUF1329 domain-containing protein [Denitromonas iodatirespirans]